MCVLCYSIIQRTAGECSPIGAVVFVLCVSAALASKVEVAHSLTLDCRRTSSATLLTDAANNQQTRHTPHDSRPTSSVCWQLALAYKTITNPLRSSHCATNVRTVQTRNPAAQQQPLVLSPFPSRLTRNSHLHISCLCVRVCVFRAAWDPV